MTNIKQQHVFISISLLFSIVGLSFFYNHYKKNSINTIQNNFILDKRISLRTKLSSHCLAPSQSINMALRHLKRKISHESSFQPQSKQPKYDDSSTFELLKNACLKGEVEKVKSLVASGIRLDNQKTEQNTLLHSLYNSYSQLICPPIKLGKKKKRQHKDMSLKKKHLNIIKILIKQKNGLNCTDENGNTILHYACSDENLALVKLLLNKGAQCDIPNNKNKTPFDCLYSKCCFHSKCCLKSAWTPKTQAYHEKMQSQILDILKIMLTKNEENYPDKNGTTLLHYACSDENLELVKFLLKTVAQCNIQDNNGKTPLHYVCRKILTNFKLVRILLENKAQCDIQDNNGKTPLHYACRSPEPNLESGELLAQCNIQDNNGKTPLHHACRKPNLELGELLAQCDIQDNNENTPLHEACRKHDLELVKLLLQSKNQNKNPCNIPDNKGNTPLHEACFHENIEVAKFLVKNGAQCNIQNNKKESPLDIIVQKGFHDLEEYFLTQQSA